MEAAEESRRPLIGDDNDVVVVAMVVVVVVGLGVGGWVGGGNGESWELHQQHNRTGQTHTHAQSPARGWLSCVCWFPAPCLPLQMILY